MHFPNTVAIETSTGWWLEIATDEPYLYLFGPFDASEEAEHAVGKYIGDLTSEGWQVTSAKVTRLGP
ncbi:MAG: DUF1816 domain-containing protein [Gemmatimonadaceae bacterium]|nr:DUF1816 domain-containing protein [Gloeobacterales cyanobacterium ES-bin-141]